MKLIIRQCKYCPLNNNCVSRELWREETRKILQGLSTTANCPDYGQLFKAGDRVKVIISNQYVGDNDDNRGKFIWQPIGEFEGVIEGYREFEEKKVYDPFYENYTEPVWTGKYLKNNKAYISHNKFYLIALDNPIKVTYEAKGFSGEISFIKKLAKDIIKLNKEVSTNG